MRGGSEAKPRYVQSSYRPPNLFWFNPTIPSPSSRCPCLLEKWRGRGRSPKVSAMDKSRLEIAPKVWLDHRRALYLEGHSVLAVADLHLGYAWAHRYHGQMLPVAAGDRLLERLTALCTYYHPRQ